MLSALDQPTPNVSRSLVSFISAMNGLARRMYTVRIFARFNIFRMVYDLVEA
jgi:hypothetical protein